MALYGDGIIVLTAKLEGGRCRGDEFRIMGSSEVVYRIIHEMPVVGCSSCSNKSPKEEPVYEGTVNVKCYMCENKKCQRNGVVLLQYGLPSILHRLGYRLGSTNTLPSLHHGNLYTEKWQKNEFQQ
ncbi:unnamed protein product [Owenia fusiformis]|uniref:Uncharacterized protein n=1 Tax=Owenia fusiformis TaxID=6347 RepID=A0A8J1TBU2_OWEFU|nr:unnamed protein product [Owenia fusiformis]